MRIIQTSNLESWAGLAVANTKFPYYVRALICAVIRPEKLRMPFGDAVWLPGFDGELVNSEDSRFVPTGKSVWEVGTGDDYMGKANDDFKKRVVKDAETTFVFVTPMIWEKKSKDEWIGKRLDKGWKDVRVIDGVDLVDWLEYAPAVSLQWASEMGFIPDEGLQASEQAWEYWSRLTDPPTSEELVVAGRQEQEDALISRLVGQPRTFAVRGDSPREAWGFVLAAMRRVPREEDRVKLDARTIVVNDEQVANSLPHLRNHIIVLKQAHKQVSGYLSSKGCYVVIPEGNDARSGRDVITLSRPTRHEFAGALERMSLPQDKAEQAARACGLSVTILQRHMPHANYERPRWCNDPNISHLLPAVLAGRWDGRNESDRNILCKLAGVDDYSTVEQYLQNFLWVDEPPLQRLGEMWSLTAPADAFHLTARSLTSSNLARFKATFQDVFGKIDPKVEVPLDDWIYVDIRGEQGHSDWLRSGMAETLLLIAERGQDACLTSVSSPRVYVEEVVRELPGLNNDWRLLASLRDQYARLMEAAPRPFLGSLERMLETRPNNLRALFVEGSGIFGGAMHTGLLWGLEIMAWSPDYLSRVALVLTQLASLDPGGRMANRPINSLREIFMWRHPGTYASIEQRLDAIDLILEREPDIGWKLLVELLPIAPPLLVYGTAMPRWRDFGELPQELRNGTGHFHYLSAIIDRALDRANNDPDRWKPLLESLATMNHSQLDRAFDQLETAADSAIPVDVKAALWETLRDFIYRYRTYQGRSLTNAQINRLEVILPRLAPNDPIKRYGWLFNEWLPDLPNYEENLDLRKEQVKELRQKAIDDTLSKHGIEGLVQVGITCKHPGYVAAIAVPLIHNINDLRSLIQRAIAAGDAGVSLIEQVSAQAYQLHGQLWHDQVGYDAKAENWSPAVTAALLSWWPDVRATWDTAVALGAETEYWHRKPIFTINGSSEEIVYQIDHLIMAGRATGGLHRIALQGEGVPIEALVRLFEATLNELAQTQTPKQLGLNSYDIRRFLANLRQREDISPEKLAQMEYQALSLIKTSDTRGLTLYKFMVNNPNFFVDLLCDAFRPHHRDKSADTELTPQERFKAEAAFSLLRGIDRIPGQNEENLIDKEAILKWVRAVRKRAAEVDRAAIADQHIGQLLARSPEDPQDGGWPHEAVRNVIEELAADEIERGLILERHNMRGFYSKPLYEGGRQERILAGQYRDWANLSRKRWLRVARVLDTIAQMWEERARREDIEAEQEKLEQ